MILDDARIAKSPHDHHYRSKPAADCCSIFQDMPKWRRCIDTGQAVSDSEHA
jgi:hypothetical protein